MYLKIVWKMAFCLSLNVLSTFWSEITQPAMKTKRCHDANFVITGGTAGIVLYMHPANEIRRYNVTSYLIGWAHIQNDPWNSCFKWVILASPSSLNSSLNHHNLMMKWYWFQCHHPTPTPNTHRALQWRHNGCSCVSNHQPHDCLLNRVLRCWSKKISKLRVSGLCVGNSLGTGEYHAQMTSNTENVSIWWCHHG